MCSDGAVGQVLVKLRETKRWTWRRAYPVKAVVFEPLPQLAIGPGYRRWGEDVRDKDVCTCVYSVGVCVFRSFETFDRMYDCLAWDGCSVLK